MKKALVVAIILLLGVASANAGIFDFITGLFTFSEPTPPVFIGGYPNPAKVRPGMDLQIITEVEDSYGIESATALFHHEKGADEVPMLMLASSPNGRYTYAATWEVHDTLNKKYYNTTVTYTNVHGLSAEGYVQWLDPTVSHTADEIEAGTFQIGDYTFPGNVTIGNFSLSNSVGSSVCQLITGGSGLCDGSDADTTGISSCSHLTTDCISATTCTSPSTGGGSRLTGVSCDCNGVAVTDQEVSVGAGNFNGQVTCKCASTTTIRAGAFSCS